jgi:acetylglutamate/LysW-gamma-L-alpha-aminoadipate kinase
VTTVVKLGGSVVCQLGPNWWDDAAAVAGKGGVVLVHGWSTPLREYQEQRGTVPVFLTNQHGHRGRLTDDAVIKDIREVAGQVRTLAERRLAERGVAVHGVDGADSGLLDAEVRAQRWWVDGELRPLDNLVGPIRRVDAEALGRLLGASDALVVTPLARSDSRPYVNTDADRAAIALAVTARARDLVLVTDVAGVLVDGAPLTRLRHTDLSTVVAQVRGGMRKKVRAAARAVDAGVERVVIGSAPISELLAGHAGTQVVAA